MSADKITPGPWEACEPGDYGDYDGRCVVILGDDRAIRVAVVLGDGAEAVANARVMAAAPALLEALRDFSEYVHAEQCSTDGAVFYSAATVQGLAIKARAAIAKAIGEGA